MKIILSITVVLIAGLISWMEVPHMIKNKQKKELVLFSLILILSTGMSVATSLEIQLPSPLNWIAVVYQPLSEWLL